MCPATGVARKDDMADNWVEDIADAAFLDSWDEGFKALKHPGPPPGQRECTDELNRRRKETPLSPLDVDADLVGRCLSCRRRAELPLCHRCYTDPKRRARWEDPATGKERPWFKRLRQLRDQHTKSFLRNRDRIDAGIVRPQCTGKPGRPPAWGVQHVAYHDGVNYRDPVQRHRKAAAD